MAIVLLVTAIGCSAKPGPIAIPPTTAPSNRDLLTKTDTILKGAISMEKLITNAQTGKYKMGEVLTISDAVYVTGRNVRYIEFGPKINGLGLIADLDKHDDNYFNTANLNEEDMVVIQGEYGGIGRIDIYGYRNGPDFVILTKVRVITFPKK